MEFQKEYVYKYPRPAVTADCVLFSYDWERETGGRVYVLVTERRNDPYKGQYALPGGFMDMNEDFGECAKRELFEETGLRVISFVQVGAYSAVDRDPRGRTISVAFAALVNKEQHHPLAGDDAANTLWVDVKNIGKLAFVHNKILRDAYIRIRSLHPNLPKLF